MILLSRTQKTLSFTKVSSSTSTLIRFYPPTYGFHKKENKIIRWDQLETNENKRKKQPSPKRMHLSMLSSYIEQNDGKFFTGGNFDEEMMHLSNDIYELHNNTKFNLLSSKQVATVIYGPPENIPTNSKRTRSIDKRTLKRMLSNKHEFKSLVSGEKWELVEKILRWREKYSYYHKKKLLNSSHSIRNFSSQNEKTYDARLKDRGKQNNMSTANLESTLSSANMSDFDDDSTKSDYHNYVEALFSSRLIGNEMKASEIDAFWKPFLKYQVTKPSVKQIVRQLHSECPLAYDPFASSLPLKIRGFGAFEYVGTGCEVTNSVVGKKGSLLAFIRAQKRRFSDTVILARVGEFYEAFGIDAIALMQHCGLNPMGGKARAGCPVKNVQNTLDCLTSNGLRVAVYEEVSKKDEATNTSSKLKRLKQRKLTQIVSPASPTYFHNLILGDSTVCDDMTSSTVARDYMGVVCNSGGYTLVEISHDERTVRVSEKLPPEVVACRITAYPPVEPLFCVSPPSSTQQQLKTYKLPFLSSSTQYAGARDLQVKYFPNELVMPEATRGMSDVERAKNAVVNILLNYLHNNASNEDPQTEDENGDVRMIPDDFVLVTNGNFDVNSLASYTQTLPLNVETATQLGLMSMDKNYDNPHSVIPSLLSAILPHSAPAATKRLLHRWLLIPPPLHVARANSHLVSLLMKGNIALPPLSVTVPIAKLLALLRVGEASAQVYREILCALDAFISVLKIYIESNSKSKQTTETNNDLASSLMVLVEYESGFKAELNKLLQQCNETREVILKVINTKISYNYQQCPEMEHTDNHFDDQISDAGPWVPRAFFERNESPWRGHVRKEIIHGAYQKVEDSVQNLIKAVASDFWGVENINEDTGGISEEVNKDVKKNPIVQDIFNNMIAMKEIPQWCLLDDNGVCQEEKKYIHPRDRNGKLLTNRFTTSSVQDALSSYIEACDEARQEVISALSNLSKSIYKSEYHQRGIVQTMHANLLLSAAANHASQSNRQGWNMAKIISSSSKLPCTECAGEFHNIWPYWMDESSTKNSFTLDGLFLLTAPNMSGKSTLMRSTAAAALLTNCGLCAPMDSTSSVKRFRSIFVRGASSDAPLENKSAFGAEMGDIAAMIRTGCKQSSLASAGTHDNDNDNGAHSLVFVDELGRGTSPTDGVSIAGAVVEAMAQMGFYGIFSTHLHSIFNIEKLMDENATKRIRKKRMMIEVDSIYQSSSKDYGYDHPISCTFKIEDGVCVESLALHTAAKFGMPHSILSRAETFSKAIDQQWKESVVPMTSSYFDCDRMLVNSLHNLGEEQKTDPVLDDAIKIIRDINATAFDPKQIVRIPPSWSSPPSFEGRSCVYIIEIPLPTYNNGKKECDTFCTTKTYYVGETDYLSQRLTQHRQKYDKNLTAIAFPVSGKSEARSIESLLIREMVKVGFNMISTSDGRTMRKYKTSIHASVKP